MFWHVFAGLFWLFTVYCRYKNKARAIAEVPFTSDSFTMRTFRFIYRVDGKPIWTKPLTPYNRGLRDMLYVGNSHNAIISKELWDKVHDELDKKGNKKLRGGTIDNYSFTGLITCPICGKSYIHKINNAGTKYACPIWR